MVYDITLKNRQYYKDFKTGIRGITLYVDGVSRPTNYEDITLNNLKPGPHTVYFTLQGKQSNTFTFYVIGESEISTPETSYEYAEGVNTRIPLIINDDSELTGTINITVNDHGNYKLLSTYYNVGNGYKISTETLAEALKGIYGTQYSSYTINITYSSTYAHSSSTEFILNINNKKNTPITLDVSVEENDVSFDVQTDEQATGIVNFTVISKENNESSTAYKDIENGSIIMPVYDVEPGNYTVIVTYMGDDKYNTNSTSQDFEVIGHIMKNTPINANAEISGNKVTLTVKVDENATGFVEVKFSDTVINIALKNGQGTYTTTLPYENYNLDITYLGDKNYNKNSTKYEFTISKPVKENPTISVDVQTDENNATMTVNVNSNATGIVKFEVTGQEEYSLYVDVIDGQAILEDVLETGNYRVVATYMGDSAYNSNITYKDFTITGHVKKDTPITADVKTSVNRVTLTVTVDENATGFVKLNVGSTIANLEITDGVATLTTTLLANTYFAEITYLGDENYNTNSTKLTFTVTDAEKNNTPITADIESIENTVTFKVNVDSNATGTIRFQVTGPEEYTLYADLTNGEAGLTDVLKAGNYTLTATYMGDSAYNTNATSKDFEIIGHVMKDTPIDANIQSSANKVTLTVTVDENATGFVKLNIGSTIVYLEVIKGIATLSTTLPYGSYNLEVTYLGDENYNKNSTKREFTLIEPEKENTTFSLNIENVENDVTITAAVDSTATGIVKFQITGPEEYTLYVDVINGQATLKEVLETGNYRVITTYMGDNKYNTNITYKDFTVTGHIKKDTPITADVKTNGNRVTLTVNVNENATGFVKLNIGSTIANLEVINGVATLTTTLAANSYFAEITYLGDENYNTNATKLTFTIVDTEKYNTPITADIETVENNVTFKVNVNTDATGTIKFQVTGSEEYTLYVDVIKGEAVLEDVLKVGNYTLTATYMGDSAYNTNLTSKDFTVNNPKPEANITISMPEDIKTGENIPVSANIPGATGNISVIVDGTETVVPLINGKADYTIPALDVGEHTISILYSGDETYNPTSVVKYISARALASEFKNITVSGNGTVTVKLVDETDTPIANADITYWISGKEFHAKLNANGVIAIDAYSNAVIELSYAGNNAILSSNATITLKDMVPARIATAIKSSAYTTYAIDADADESGNYFKVQLVDADGNPLANKDVKIGFNGRVYNKTTDASGWAQLQINLKKEGTYTFAIAFLGDEDYNASFVVQKITVNKKKTSIAASAKSYKATTKTKTYTVTLKTDKGSSIDGKTYLKSGKKITLKINGKTYTAKTNSKGQAKFSLKITKKGKFSTSIKFAGDNTYNAVTKKVKITIK